MGPEYYFDIQDKLNFKNGIHSTLIAALLFFGACNSNTREQASEPSILYAPIRTYCPNRLDYISVQDNHKWMFTDVEVNAEGTAFIEGTIGDLSSRSEAISKCE